MAAATVPQPAAHLLARGDRQPRGQDNKKTTNSTWVTCGVQGAFGTSNWNYTADITYTENKLTEATHVAFTDAITTFFSTLFGPKLGPDPFYRSQPTYSLELAPISITRSRPPSTQVSPAMPHSYSRTEESLGRAQLTDPTVRRPGGYAGVALRGRGRTARAGTTPDPRFLDGGLIFIPQSPAGPPHALRGTTKVRLRWSSR